MATFNVLGRSPRLTKSDAARASFAATFRNVWRRLPLSVRCKLISYWRRLGGGPVITIAAGAVEPLIHACCLESLGAGLCFQASVLLMRPEVAAFSVAESLAMVHQCATTVSTAIPAVNPTLATATAQKWGFNLEAFEEWKRAFEESMGILPDEYPSFFPATRCSEPDYDMLIDVPASEGDFDRALPDESDRVGEYAMLLFNDAYGSEENDLD